MNSVIRKSGIVVLTTAGMSMAFAMPASASGQDGLVNVATGDITILRDVNVAAVVPVVAQLCNLNVLNPSNVSILSAAVKQVDKSGKSYTVCKTAGGDVKIVQN